MCGIAGILRVHPAGAPALPPEVAIPEAWLDILDDSIKHRGPDGQGRFRDRATRPDGSIVDVALVHRRLAIIDPATGHQPMVSERGRKADEGLIAVVFNGCIYNHRELRKELQAAGHRFETDHSDTEVLVHGWREWGTTLPRHLDAMHALAIWDRSKALLFLSVDLAGEKPLYFAHARPGAPVMAFASSVAALARFTSSIGQAPVVDSHPFGFHDLLQYGLLTNGHGYASVTGVHRVAPRIPLTCRAGAEGLWIERQTDDNHVFSGRQSAGWAPRADRGVLNSETAESAIQDACQSRLESDVPMGCFLSGGVDSSIVALFARRALGSLRTFCLRMPELRYDESAFAARAASAIGSQHTTLECLADPAADLARLVTELGWPLGDSSLLPTYWVARAARQHVGVVLTGDGGDELFGGYERYRAAGWLSRFGKLLAFVPPGLVSDADTKTRTSKVARLASAARGGGYPDLLAIFPSEDFERLTNRPARKPWSESPLSDPVAGAIYFDLLNYLPGDLLPKVDTASMSVALESRAPLLSRELMLAATNTPIAALMPHAQRKGLLRAVARKYLPSEIVDRPKQGFAIPIGEWFRTDYGGMKALLLDHLNSAEPWGPPSLGIALNMSFVRQMLDEHLGTGMSGRVKRDHSQRLYMLLVLSIWAKWLGGLGRS